MPLGLIGIKQGMTQIYSDEGVSHPVTVIKVEPNLISQIKTTENDAYEAVQLTTGVRKAKRVNKAMAGHFAKANVQPGQVVKEFRLDDPNNKSAVQASSLQVGQALQVDCFTAGQKVHVQAKSKGRGFTGVITRHNFRSQRASHGNSLAHNAPGSIGQNQSPGRVFKGKKMAGQWGNETVSVRNLEVVRVDTENQLLLVKGAVPGAPGGLVTISPVSQVSQPETSSAETTAN